ncbi:MAG: gluconeogenesis factor YvcK family protein [Coriobacteriia bacterium]
MSIHKRAVAIGGGTGLPLVLACLDTPEREVTAVVTVADDGGSSGWLRRELGVLPPGDIRNCLVALADKDNELAKVFQYRFRSGEGLAGHALGNLIIAALADIEGDFAVGIEAAAELLGARGRVLPSTLESVVLMAEDTDGGVVTGQVNVARSTSPVKRVHMEPGSPAAFAPVLEAIAAADLVVIGPGSLYTSVIPNLLVDGIADALATCPGKVVYICNVANQRGETTGMDAADHVRALLDHGLTRIDAVIVHDTDVAPLPVNVPAVAAGAHVRDAIRALGAAVIATDVADAINPMHHDPALVCAALRRVE